MRSTSTTVGLLAILLLGWAGSAAAARDTLVISMPTDVPIFDTHKATGLHSRFWRPAGNNLSFSKSEEFDRLLDAEQGTRSDEAGRDPAPLAGDPDGGRLYGEPSIWAAKKSLKGIDFNPLECLHPLPKAYFEE